MTENKTALVAGGTGGIGEGLVQALITGGYEVYVPVRDIDQTERLRDYVADSPSLHPVPANLCDERAVAVMRDAVLRDRGRIDAVVVSVGAGYYGYRLHRMPREDWDQSILDNLVTHFNTQRVFIDQLRRQNGGVYVTLIGPEAENPGADAGMVSIMAAAQKMMTRVLAEESTDTKVRVHALTAHTTIHTRSRGENTNPDWITAGELGQYVLGLIEARIPGHDQVQHELRDLAHVRSMLGKR